MLVTNLSTSNLYRLDLNGEYHEFKDFEEHIKFIRQAKQNDVIELYITTYGGRISIMHWLIKELLTTPATLRVYVGTELQSAGVTIILALLKRISDLHIFEGSAIMFHRIIGFYYGNQKKVTESYESDVKRVDKSTMELYKVFLPNKHYKRVKRGDDVSISAKQFAKYAKKYSPNTNVVLKSLTNEIVKDYQEKGE